MRRIRFSLRGLLIVATALILFLGVSQWRRRDILDSCAELKAEGLIRLILHQDRPARRLQTVSVNPVERRSVELEHAVPCQPQVAMAIRVDTHDLLARQPVFGRVVSQ